MKSEDNHREGLSYSIVCREKLSKDQYWVELIDKGEVVWKDFFLGDNIELVVKILSSRTRAKINIHHKNKTIRSLCRNLLGLPLAIPRFRKNYELWKRFSFNSLLTSSMS